MKPTPFVNKFIRSTIPNTISAQHLAISITYEVENNRRSPVKSIEIHASPILSYNYNLEYESSSELLPRNGNEGYLKPISLFNLSGDSGYWCDDLCNKEYMFYDDKVWSYDEYYSSMDEFITSLRDSYSYKGVIDSDCGFYSPSVRGHVKPKTQNEILSETIMELIDKNSDTIPEGDYLKICDELTKIRRL